MAESDVAEVRARLKQALETGEVIGILYHGGSQPGAYRQITPIQVGDNQVRARCYMSNAVKMFALDKIELRDAASPTTSDLSSIWSPHAKAAIPALSSVTEVAAHYRSSLEAQGWHIEYECNDEGEYLCLYAHLKNGRLRKHPTVSLGYETMGYDLVVTPDGGTERANFRPRTRPWSVTAKGGKSGTWSHIEGAIRCFLEAAAAEQPS
jgi:hypothetical protein